MHERSTSSAPASGSLSAHACGATAAHSWSRRADQLQVATCRHEACGLRAASAAAAVPMGEREQRRPARERGSAGCRRSQRQLVEHANSN